MDEFELTRDEVEQLADSDNEAVIVKKSNGNTYAFRETFNPLPSDVSYELHEAPSSEKWNLLLNGEENEFVWDWEGVRVTMEDEPADEPTFSDTALIEILEKCDVADDTARKLLESRGYSVENVVFDETGERVLPPQ